MLMWNMTIADELKIYKVIFHINIVNFLYYLDIVIYFIRDYIKIYDKILRKGWTHNEL